jgi:hypothetical protein
MDRPLSELGGADPGKKDFPVGRSSRAAVAPGAGWKSAASSLSSSPEKLHERSLSEAEEGEDGTFPAIAPEMAPSFRFFFAVPKEVNLERSISVNRSGSAASILLPERVTETDRDKQRVERHTQGVE